MWKEKCVEECFSANMFQEFKKIHGSGLINSQKTKTKDTIQGMTTSD